MSRLKAWLVKAGLPGLLARFYSGRGAILVFHRIRPRDSTWLFEVNHRNSVAPEAFVALLDALDEAGISVVTLEEAMARLTSPRKGRFVCLTFDDGYRDNHDVVLPLVIARNMPITVYVTPGLIDATAPLWWYALDQVISREERLRLPFGAECDLLVAAPAQKQAAFDAAIGFMLRANAQACTLLADALAERYGVDFPALAAEHMMDWAQIRRMAASPLVEIGSHTASHPSLAQLTGSEVLCELTGSRERLEAEIGRPVQHLAYPFGVEPAIAPRELALAAESGYRTAVTTYPGNIFPYHAKTPHALPRHGIGPHDGNAALALKLAGMRRLRLGDWRPIVTRPGETRP